MEKGRRFAAEAPLPSPLSLMPLKKTT